MKFIPSLAQLTAPLRDLLKKDNEWMWTEQHDFALCQVKQALTSGPVLTIFRRNTPTRVAANSLSFGLGAVMEQLNGEIWKPVIYASRSLTPTESRYAQIEKEALAITWACEKFSHFLLGIQFEILTDHKPLVELLGKKPISDLSARLQRFRMRLLCFDYKIHHVPGNIFYTPDLLSRSPLEKPLEDKDILEEYLFINIIIESLPCSDMRLAEIKKCQNNDEDCKLIKTYLSNDVCDKRSIFWKYRSEFSIYNDLVMKSSAIFIPRSMRKEILNKIHHGHMGITKCRRRAKESVWWPGYSVDIDNHVSNCSQCIQQRTQRSEPLMTTKLPEYPWTNLGADLCKLNGKWFLHCPRLFFKIFDCLTSASVIARLKNLFARHGVPLTLRTDGGSQFTSNEFKLFAEEYGFATTVSSPQYPQANREAEKAVDIAKRILTQCKDANLGLLAYTNTPLESGLSPAELLYGRKLRNTLPSVENYKKVSEKRLEIFKKKDHEIKIRNKTNFDDRKGVRNLTGLKNGDLVWVRDMKRYGKVKEQFGYPRSYLVSTSQREVRRNRRDLIEVEPENRDVSTSDHPIIPVTENEPVIAEEDLRVSTYAKKEQEGVQDTSGNHTPISTTRYGRIIRVPQRYADHC